MVRSYTKGLDEIPVQEGAALVSKHAKRDRRVAHIGSMHEKHKSDVKKKWGPTISHLLTAFWKFLKTPSGFLITIYLLNIVVSPDTSKLRTPQQC